MKRLLILIVAMMFTGACDQKPAKVKLGYLVKQPEEPWFQYEWTWAQKCADKNGFELIKLGTTDGEKVLTAIDNLGAQGAQGFVICTPDVKLGTAIVDKAKTHNLKVISVDDRFVGPDGKFLEEVPHYGVDARTVGHISGQTMIDEMKRRGWSNDETSACIVTFEELDTARERTEGIIEKLIENGFPKDHIYKTPQKTTDVPGSFDATNILLTRKGDVKKWLAAGMNDTATLGAVRALEGRGFNADNVIGVGINGTDCVAEFRKSSPTGFYGSVLMEANLHGYESTERLYKWVSGGPKPDNKFTGGVLITRENFEQVLKQHGLLD
jgi:L-arabinose transport system substrate-binding protein